MFLPDRRTLWAVLIVFALLGLSVSGPLTAYKIHRIGSIEAVIVSDVVEGRSGPGEDFLLVFTLHEGTKAAVERVEAGWVLVRLSTGLGGWVPSTTIEAI